MTTSMLEGALQVIARGWRVHPLAPNSKKPITPHGFKDATTDPAQIHAWWTQCPTANLALATGVDSGIAVIEIDSRKGFELFSTAFPGLLNTYTVKSGRATGGLHLYYRISAKTRSITVRDPDWAKDNKKPNLFELKADGRYVVAPPSIHDKTGQPYVVLHDVPLLELAQDLIEWLQAHGKTGQTREIAVRTAEPPAYLRGLPKTDRIGLVVQSLSRFEGSPEDVARLLAHLNMIPPDCPFDDWIAVGMSLYNTPLIGEQGTHKGVDIWDEWSQKGQKYLAGQGGLAGRGKIDYHWSRFATDRPAGERRGPGTIFYLARKYNPDGNPQTSAPASAARTCIGLQSDMNGHASAAQLVPPSTQPIQFDCDKHGRIKVTAKNTRNAIRHLGVCCRYDEFHDFIDVGGNIIAESTGVLTDHTEHILRLMVDKGVQAGFEPSMTTIHEAVQELALENRYNPLLDELDSLQWDGVKRLETMWTVYFGAEDTELHRAMARIVLPAAIRRAYEPGWKFDQCIVLEGVENLGKSKAVEILAGRDNFSDETILDQTPQRQQELLRGVWMYEIADLSGMPRAEIEKVKAFLSRKVDRGRKVWDRNISHNPRRCIFFATTNEENYLLARTGNRRFWPIRCGAIDADALARDRTQLLAEAKIIEESGADLILPKRYWKAINQEQELRRETDVLEEVLEEVSGTECEGELRVFSVTVRRTYLQAMPQVSTRRVSQAMRALGWTGPKNMRIGERLGKGYARTVTTVTTVT